MANQRAYPASCFYLELDDKKSVGFFRSLEGGGIRTDVLDSRIGNVHGLWRQLAKPKYEDIKIQVGMSMADTFYKWIEKFFSGEVERKNGAIVAGDFQYKIRARRTMEDVLISEVSIPKLDGNDRNACYMTVTLVPTRIRFEKVTGDTKIDPTGLSDAQKLWTPNNFTFSLDKWPEACRRVTRVDGFTIKQQILEYRYSNAHRSSRDAIRVPGLLEIPNLSFYLPESDADPIIEHFTKTVIEGEPQQQTRHNGQIAFNDHGGDQLCRIELSGVDISNVMPEKSDWSSEDIKLVKVDITVEKMSFHWAAPTASSGASGGKVPGGPNVKTPSLKTPSLKTPSLKTPTFTAPTPPKPKIGF